MSEQVSTHPSEPAAPGPGMDDPGFDASFDPAFDAAYPPLPYHRLHLAGAHGWLRTIGGVTVLAGLMVIVAPLVCLAPFVVWFAVSGQDVAGGVVGLLDLTDPTPLGLAYLMASLAALIPATWCVSRVFHRTRPRWLTSVAPRMRWGWWGICTLLAVVALIASLVVGLLLPTGVAGTDPAAGPNEFTTTTRDFLLVVLLLVPLQAAGEEYAFRGYLAQAIGGVLDRVWVVVMVPALLFALAHGLGQSLPVFFDRLAFGIIAGLLVVLTGGLEAAIAMHVLNNLVAFGLALAYGDIASSLTPTEASWWLVPSTLTQSLVYLGLVLWVARSRGVATRASGRALVASQRRV